MACMAYRENGKCYVHGSLQSQSLAKPSLARYLVIESNDLVYIGEYCDGDFDSKIDVYPLMWPRTADVEKDRSASVV